jgi:hypothetical protein
VSRVHEGCGTRNPFRPWMGWVVTAVVTVAQLLVLAITGTLWGLLAYIVYAAWFGLVFRWERIHSTSKMYQSWWP